MGISQVLPQTINHLNNSSNNIERSQGTTLTTRKRRINISKKNTHRETITQNQTNSITRSRNSSSSINQNREEETLTQSHNKLKLLKKMASLEHKINGLMVK